MTITTAILAKSSFPENLTEFNGKLYFAADDGESGKELFVSDGTEEGTKLIKDLFLGVTTYGYNPNNSYPTNFIEFNDKLYFVADDGESGLGLFVSDGTAEGTQLKTNLDILDSNLSSFVEFNDRLYFSAFGDRETGRELWVTDGTTEGTQLGATLLE